MGNELVAIAPSWEPKKEHKHELGVKEAKVWAPAGTPRFYSVQTCSKCGGEVGHHSAGHFATPEMFKLCQG